MCYDINTGGFQMDSELLILNIKRLCKEHGITIAGLEKELSFGAGLISRWNKSSPSLDKIIEIATYFGTSIDILVGNYTNHDELVKKLYKETINGNMNWFFYMEEKNIIKMDAIIIWADSPEIYYSEYKNGLFIVVGQYNEAEGIANYTAELYIQPSKEASPVLQSEDTETIELLWKELHTKFVGKYPEFEAEKLKNDFINHMDSLDLVDEEELLDILESNEFKSLQKIFSRPEVQEIMNFLNNKQFQKLLSYYDKFI